MPAEPTTLSLDDLTKRGLAKVCKVCPTPRSMSAAVRGIVAKYMTLLELQIAADGESMDLCLVRIPKGKAIDSERLDLKF